MTINKLTINNQPTPNLEGKHCLKARKDDSFSSASLSRIARTPCRLLWQRKPGTQRWRHRFLLPGHGVNQQPVAAGHPWPPSVAQMWGFCPPPGLALRQRGCDDREAFVLIGVTIWMYHLEPKAVTGPCRPRGRGRGLSPGTDCAQSWAPQEAAGLGMGTLTGNGLPDTGRIQRVLGLEGEGYVV